MTEDTGPDENSEGNVIIPEVVEDDEDILSPQEKLLVDDAVRFINQTVKAMILNAELRIGDYLLTVFFHNDIKRATSRNAFKNASLSSLCRRPEISLDRRYLGSMIKVAAQERFIRQIDFDTSGLNYTHRLYLTRLPDGETKIDLVDECANRGLSVRKLLLRIQGIENSEKDGGEIAPERMISQFISRMNRSVGKIAIPGTLSDPGLFSGLSPDTRMELKSKTMQLIEHIEGIRDQYSSLLEMLENNESNPP
ncbi:MAG: hypothetical protein GXP53_03180 [Deltaproteobacteria bacterium]|nr:hypothetical protein [Deltaproteobacteria bacterium]